MAVKQVLLLTVIKTSGHEAMFVQNGHPESVARHNSRRARFEADIESAEQRIDQLLHDGYEIVAQTNIETDSHGGVNFIFWKKDRGETDNQNGNSE